MKKLIPILSALFLGASATLAYSYDQREHWHDNDIHHFHEHDMERWHRGYWSQSFHEGRTGWWWIVGDQWYFYPAPVYPYPNPYIPPTVVVTAQPAGQPQYWYCANPSGYYPYISQCLVQWQSVSATTTVPATTIAPSTTVIQSAPIHTQESDNQRELDDRQLNAFAVELLNINSEEIGATKHIKSLQSRVKAFHAALFTRSYNAMDILKDTENLEERIAKKKVEIQNN